MERLLYAIFFLSGVVALLFETLWFRQAGLALGNTVWASSIVLSAFMAGLALGNALAARLGDAVRRPILVYAGLELTIALTGVAITLLLPDLGSWLRPLLEPVLDWPELLNSLRLGAAFGALLLPATAMGATLPLLVKALYARSPLFGSVLGTLYGWNTFGAVVGAIAGEIALIGLLGVRGTAFLAAALGLGAAAGAAWLAPRLEPGDGDTDVRSAEPMRLTPRAWGLLAASFLCGGNLLALEVLWFRFLLLFVPGTPLVFAIMLAVVLAGIAAGGLVAARWLRASPDAHRWLAHHALAAGALTIGAYTVFDPSLGLLGLASALMLPVSLISGVLFTLQGAALHARIGGESRSAGWLTLANTSGGIAGSALAGFVLLPKLGLEHSFLWTAALYGVAALCLLELRGLRRRAVRPLLGVAVAVFAAAFALFPLGALMERFLPLSSRAVREAEGSRLVALREGINGTLRFLRTDFLGLPLHYRLLTNGYSMSATQLSSRRYMKLYVYLPVAVHPRPERALLIGFGVGQTAKALADTAGLRQIDVVDPSRGILELSSVAFPDPEERPLRDPRVRVHLEDARFFLQTTSERYDVITGEPPPPKMSGVVNLYTRDFFELVRERLAEGGITTYWLPGLSLTDLEARAIVRAFGEVFPNFSLWQGWGVNLMLVGSREPGGSDRPVSEAHFRRQWEDPRVGPELRALGIEQPEQLGALFLADAEMLRDETRGVLPLVDNYPRRLSPLPLSGEQAWKEMSPWLDEERARGAFQRSEWIRRHWPAELRERTPPFFDLQALVNQSPFVVGGGPAPLERLHKVVSGSTLRTLVLWLLGSDEYRQRIVDVVRAHGSDGPDVHFHLAVRALADRDYSRAAVAFERTVLVDPSRRSLWIYQAYSLCMAGQLDEARSLGRLRRGGSSAEEEAWSWLHRTFDL